MEVESDNHDSPFPLLCSLTMRTALSMSQSLKMMRGDFPPSSRETFFRLLSAQLWQEITQEDRKKLCDSYLEPMRRQLAGSYLFMICLPIGVEPVKPSLRMCGWSERRCPTMPPGGGRGFRNRSKGLIRNWALSSKQLKHTQFYFHFLIIAKRLLTVL